MEIVKPSPALPHTVIPVQIVLLDLLANVERFPNQMCQHVNMIALMIQMEHQALQMPAVGFCLMCFLIARLQTIVQPPL